MSKLQEFRDLVSAVGALVKAYGQKIDLSSAFMGEADARDQLAGDIRNRNGRGGEAQWRRFVAIETTPASGQYSLYDIIYKLMNENPMPGSTYREAEVVRVNLTPGKVYTREEAFNAIHSRDQAFKHRAAGGTQPG